MASDRTLRLVRHATLELLFGDRRILVDPMLGDVGVAPPIENSPTDDRNPMVPLPVLDRHAIDAVVVTHRHRDHFDEAARGRLDTDRPLFCQPEEAAAFQQDGFTDVRPVEDAVDWDGIHITRTGGRHGHDDLAEAMGPVSGFVFEHPNEPTVFVAGDTVWCPELADALAAHDPDVVVLNAGGARFTEGEPITMTDADVAEVVRTVPDAQVVAVHMEAINHCLQTRDDLRAALEERGLGGRVAIPSDGAWVRG